MIIRSALAILIFIHLGLVEYILDAAPIQCGEHIPFVKDHNRVEDQVEDGELPFLVDITVINSNADNLPRSINCSGTLLSRNKVLTTIKCLGDNNNSNYSYIIRVGSNRHSQGRLVDIDRRNVYHFETEPLEPDCGQELVQEGLAILTLKQKIQYTLGQEQKINRICLKHRDDSFEFEANQILYSSSWIYGQSNRLKLIPVKTIVCSRDVKDTICMKNSKSGPLRLQEGAPLFRYNSEGMWTIAGIHTRNYSPWNKACNEVGVNSETFLDLNKGPYIDWVKSHEPAHFRLLHIGSLCSKYF